MRRVNRLLNYKFFSLLGNFLGISCFGVKLEKNLNVQGRQSVPKSGRSERGKEFRGLSDNCSQEPTF